MKRPIKISVLIAGTSLLALGIWAIRGTNAQTVTPDWVDEPATVQTTAAASTPPVTTPTVRHQQRLDEMAALLGITPSDLQSELQIGKQFYQIAAEHGVTYDKLKANRDTQVKTRLDDMVKVGYLTQAEADTAYQQYQTSTVQAPLGDMMGMGHGFHHGFGM